MDDMEVLDVVGQKLPFTVIRGRRIGSYDCCACRRCHSHCPDCSFAQFEMSYTDNVFKPIYYTEGYLHAEIIATMNPCMDFAVGNTVTLKTNDTKIRRCDKGLLKILKAGFTAREKRAAKEAADNVKARAKFKKEAAAKKKKK